MNKSTNRLTEWLSDKLVDRLLARKVVGWTDKSTYSLRGRATDHRLKRLANRPANKLSNWPITGQITLRHKLSALFLSKSKPLNPLSIFSSLRFFIQKTIFTTRSSQDKWKQKCGNQKYCKVLHNTHGRSASAAVWNGRQVTAQNLHDYGSCSIITVTPASTSSEKGGDAGCCAGTIWFVTTCSMHILQTRKTQWNRTNLDYANIIYMR